MLSRTFRIKLKIEEVHCNVCMRLDMEGKEPLETEKIRLTTIDVINGGCV